MFRVELDSAMQQWIENYDGEDGSLRGSLRVGIVARSQQRYDSMRELSIVGGVST